MKNDEHDDYDFDYWIRRGDELYDQLQQAFEEVNSMRKTIETLAELREKNAELRKLLNEHNINFDI